MLLEQQLAKSAEFGLTLNHGITVDDLTYSFGREDLEQKPFDLILFVLGMELESAAARAAPFTRGVWNFDLECIESTGDYIRIVKRLCEAVDPKSAT